MFARCLHFSVKMLVSWDGQTQSHWPVAPFRGGGCDAEGGKELRALSSSVPLETGPAGHTNPSPTRSPLTIFIWWEHWQRLVLNWKPSIPWNQLSRARLSKNTLMWSWLLLGGFLRACALVLETFCHASAHTFSLSSSPVLSALVALILYRVCVCVCVHVRQKTVWLRLKQFPVAFLSCDRDVTISSLTKGNNGEPSCVVLPPVTRSFSDIRHFLMPKTYPPGLNGLLDIDLATQKEDLSFYPI